MVRCGQIAPVTASDKPILIWEAGPTTLTGEPGMRPDFSGPLSERASNEPVPLNTNPANLTWLVVLIIVVGLGLAGWKLIGSSSDPWLHDLSAGLAEAGESGKGMFVLYTADWCPPCRELKRNALRDPAVDAFLQENFVRVKIDLSSRRGPNNAIATEHEVSGIPTIILYNHRGMEIDRVTGGGAISHWLRKNSGY